MNDLEKQRLMRQARDITRRLDRLVNEALVAGVGDELADQFGKLAQDTMDMLTEKKRLTNPSPTGEGR